MSIIRWSPMTNLLSRWPDVWDDDLLSPMSSGSNSLDVYETENEVTVKANVAGVPEDKIDLTFEKGILTIAAEMEEQHQDEERKHYAKSSWKYSYRVAVPGMLDHTVEPKAEVKDGVIMITFKKAEAAKAKKLAVKRAA
jgi:HSP20 family protein